MRWSMLCLIFCISWPCPAQEDESSLLDIVFIQIENGKEFIYLRMPLAQWRSAKARSRFEDEVSLAVNNRQRLALKKVLGEKYDWEGISVSVDGVHLSELKGLKNHYLVLDKEKILAGKGQKIEIKGRVVESDIDIGRYEYQRQPVPAWELKPDDYLLLINANIVDVDKGEIKKERGVLVRNFKIELLILPQDLAKARQKLRIKKEIDVKDRYLIPGLSDIHCHPTLISEFEMGPLQMRYFPGQRLKNAEEALKNGCTLVRDCGGAANQVEFLQEEIAADRLLGPKIIASKGAITPKGGMWDVGRVQNELARLIFGGKLLWFPENDRELLQAMEDIHRSGNDFFKFYFEEKPLYGGDESTVYNMFTLEQARMMRKKADEYGKHLAAHAMFMPGVDILIEAGFDTVEHASCDQPYTVDLAQKMKGKGIAFNPTLSLGCYLSMNCGKKGYYDNPEVIYFQELRSATYREEIGRYVIPELQAGYVKFFEWLAQPLEERSMPMVGQVYPDRVHNFARFAPESMANIKKAGTKVGVGTDGGTGITFCGNVAKETAILHRYGYSAPEVLRMATLGNMEILKLDREMGSIHPGKYADMVVLEKNPLEHVEALETVAMVFKNGRLYYRK